MGVSMITAPFHALSDPLRLQIIELLRNRELCVCDLCEALNVSQSKLSFHLKILKEANLLSNRQQGRWVYYQINSDGFQVLTQYLAQYSHYQIQSARMCED
jgi:ArsR family transcriptional regulator